MIINKTLVSFAGRTPSPRYVPVGVVGDNLVECVEFRLPTIDADQTATMLLKCKYADAITLTRTDTMTYCADITAQIAGESGKFEAYIRIDGAGGAVWNSEPFMLCVCNVPDISGDVEDREPGALEQTLSAIAAHNAAIKQHSEDMEETAEAASESAENAEESAGRAEAAAKRAEEISEPYTLPVATADRLGGVIIGDGLQADEDGRVSTRKNLSLYTSREVKDGETVNVITEKLPGNIREVQIFVFFPKVAARNTRVTGRVGDAYFYIPDGLDTTADKWCVLRYRPGRGALSFSGEYAAREGYTNAVKMIGMHLRPFPYDEVDVYYFTLNNVAEGYPVGTKVDIYIG